MLWLHMEIFITKKGTVKMNSLLDTIVSGIISGIMASFCYAMVMFLVRPRIKISEDIAKWRDVYYVKVVNKTFSTITDLDYSLYYCVHHADGVSTTTEIKPIKEKLILISKNNPLRKKYSDNALQLTYKIDMNKFPLNDEDRCLEFHVLGNHCFSNTKKCVKQIFFRKNVKEGIFETGNSVNVLVNHTTIVDPSVLQDSINA